MRQYVAYGKWITWLIVDAQMERLQMGGMVFPRYAMAVAVYHEAWYIELVWSYQIFAQSG